MGHARVQGNFGEQRAAGILWGRCEGTAGQSAEVLLHETAVAWIRRREETTRPREPWKETLEEFGARLRGVCQDINDSCDVEGLCRALPKRVQALAEAQGDRIRP